MEDSNRIVFRVLLGGIIGFIVFFSVTWAYNWMSGFTPNKINPYIATFPMMRSIVMGWFGSVLGALLGMFSIKWKQTKE